MEREEILEKGVEFLKEFYYSDLVSASMEGKRSLAIDFTLLDRFDPELADLLLEKPEETISAMEEALKEIDVPSSLPEDFRLRFFNLPESREIRIRNIRAEHLGKLLVVDGIVKRASEVRPEVKEAIFECPECGSRISVEQKERTIKPPARCACGNRRGFVLVDQKLYDARWIVIEEPFEITSGERPSEIMVYLKEDLTTPRMQNKTDPGNRIKVVGILKELPRRVRGSRSKQMEIFLEANYVESVEVEWEEIEITPEDEKRIIELAKDPDIYSKLVASLAPSIFGMEEVKEALLLQMFGGETHVLPDGTKIRGNIHILIVGDPAAGKSQLMQLVTRLMPRAKYVSGTGVSGVGLTATVVRDEDFLGGWVLDAGAVVMANKSICAIDEFDKIGKDDRVKLQEAMSLGTISIAKASIVATLPAQTSILAGANPKLGRFDPYIPIREQLDVDDVLLSRFDLKFAIRDIPNPERDAQIADHILRARHFQTESTKPLIEPEFLRKYIAYARARVHPKLSEEAAQVIKEFYLEMRKRSGEESPVPITLRQYEALIRLAEASAKVQLRDVVTKEDALRAINLMKASLRQFGFDVESGKFDIDRAEGRMTARERGKVRTVLDIIEELTEKMGKNIPKEDVITLAKSRGLKEFEVEKILQALKNSGDIFEPRPGMIQKV